MARTARTTTATINFEPEVIQGVRDIARLTGMSVSTIVSDATKIGVEKLKTEGGKELKDLMESVSAYRKKMQKQEETDLDEE